MGVNEVEGELELLAAAAELPVGGVQGVGEDGELLDHNVQQVARITTTSLFVPTGSR